MPCQPGVKTWQIKGNDSLQRWTDKYSYGIPQKRCAVLSTEHCEKWPKGAAIKVPDSASNATDNESCYLECRIYDCKMYGVGRCDEEKKLEDIVCAGDEMERQKAKRIRRLQNLIPWNRNKKEQSRSHLEQNHEGECYRSKNG